MHPRSASFLVTAGSTRERIDEVRNWGSIFTGNTGLAIARELARYGRVDLLTSNLDHLRQIEIDGQLAGRIAGVAFATHADLKALLEARMAGNDYRAVFMSAAVSDHSPAGVYEIISRQPPSGGGGVERWEVRCVQSAKVSSGYGEIAVRGQQTQKLVDLFRGEWGYRGLLVKFKLEVGVDESKLLEIGRASRRASGADWLVANTLEMVEGAGAGAFLIGADEDRAEFVPRPQLAERLARLAVEGVSPPPPTAGVRLPSAP